MVRGPVGTGRGRAGRGGRQLQRAGDADHAGSASERSPSAEELEALLEDGTKKLVRCVGTQTEARPDDPLPPLPPVETDSGKGTEAEVSTPETPLSPLSVIDSRSEPDRGATAVTPGFTSVGVFGDLSSHPVPRKDSVTHAGAPPSDDEQHKLRHVEHG
ncbi:hypothetical protein FJT64_026785 [Amphibalanus amphitrite]|uniref:Uncharacterized protein n=1 Tax=Amphibalanus amphitrite TaxID=1232801 RepID=A0A6A4W0P4_AMPAM|nr:hypothetical protein FJT64_026785 [Amphibalanus amphitrite]